jgi:predicted outer membrane repeat protein
LNSTFTNNTAPHGCAGAVYIDDAKTLMMGSIFLNNLAHNCGALALNSGHTEIEESNFLSNRATNDGGVICTSADMSDVSISTGNFSDNHAERNGGVMIIEPPTNEHYGHKSIHFVINGHSYFDHNSAGSQGGVFATFSRSDFLIGTSFFFENQAGIEGGVIYVRDTNSLVNLYLHDQLGFNRAAKRGGVISINGSSLFIGAQIDIFNNSADMGAVISACSSNVSLSPHILYQYNDPNFPNCLLYDVIENEPLTDAVTTPTIPPTGAKHLDAGLAVAIVVPIVVFLVFVLIIAAALTYAYWPKCKKSVSIGRYGVKKSEIDDPDSAPLMGNA